MIESLASMVIGGLVGSAVGLIVSLAWIGLQERRKS